MLSHISHKLSIIKYVVLKKIIFYFLCFDRLIWTWTRTRTSLDSVLTRTRTSLDSVSNLFGLGLVLDSTKVDMTTALHIPTREGQGFAYGHLKKSMQIHNIVLWQTFHKFIHKFTQSVLWSTVFLIIMPYFCWRLLLSLKLTNKGDMKRTTPFQCFRKPAPEAAAASGDTLQCKQMTGTSTL